MKTKTIIILIFALLSIGGLFAFFNRSVPTPPINILPPENNTGTTAVIDTSDWETYRSEEFGYEIKYPKGVKWETSPYADGVGMRLGNLIGVPPSLLQEELDKAGGSGFEFTTGVMIQEIENPEHLPVGELVVNEGMENKRKTVSDSGKDIIFAGEPAYYAEAMGYGQIGSGGLYRVTHYSIFFFHNGYLFEIGAIKPPPDPSEKWKNHPLYAYFDKYVPISEAIIKSFRFTNAAREPSPSVNF